MSPIIDNRPSPEAAGRVAENPAAVVPEPSVSGLPPAPDDADRAALQMTPEEALEDEENNPWRNHEDDRHKWLGLLLAAVGFGAIGYLVSGV